MISSIGCRIVVSAVGRPPRHRHVVEPEESEIARTRPSCRARSIHRSHADEIVAAKDRLNASVVEQRP